MPDTATHPTDDAIGAFALGKLDPPEATGLEEHLAGCDTCQERAEAVAPDTLVQLLASARTLVDARRPAAQTPTPDGAATPSPLALTGAWGGGETGPAEDTDAPAVLADHPKYRVVRRLGAGGMGTVWLAEHAVMTRPVAVKVIRPDLLARPGAADRFLREVRAAARLHHPNIVTAFDAEPAGDSCLFVMEYVPGETLADRVAVGPLPVAEACRAARDAARGLTAAHAAGLVHRDVKPHNLIRAADGAVKVLDFGLAGVAAGEVVAAGGDGLTGAGMVVGTPDYIAPEQADDPHVAGPAADVYGLGCTLYHLLAGRPPFPDGPPLAKLDAHRTATPDPIPGLPAGLAAVLAKMMAKRPEDRYRTAEAVAAALEPFCRPAPLPARRRPRWGVLVALGLLSAGVVLAAGVVIIRDKDGTIVGWFRVPPGGSAEVRTDPPPSRSDKELIQGSWKAASGERDGGTKLTAEELKTISVTFDGDKMTILMRGREDTGTFTLDQTHTPRHITVVASARENYRGMTGIYALDGDTLTVCMGDAKDGRPTEFRSRAGTSILNVVLHRLSGAELPGSPKGTFAIPKGGGPPWALTLDGKGKFTMTRNGEVRVEGIYKITGDQIEFTDEAGPDRGRGDEQTGTYRWRLAGWALLFTPVKDNARGRMSILIGGAWIKTPESVAPPAAKKP